MSPAIRRPGPSASHRFKRWWRCRHPRRNRGWFASKRSRSVFAPVRSVGRCATRSCQCSVSSSAPMGSSPSATSWPGSTLQATSAVGGRLGGHSGGWRTADGRVIRCWRQWGGGGTGLAVHATVGSLYYPGSGRTGQCGCCVWRHSFGVLALRGGADTVTVVSDKEDLCH